MLIEPGAVDANVLVYAVDLTANHHLPSRALLDQARRPDTILYLASQVLCEFYAVVTNPRRVSAVRSPEDALYAIDTLLAYPGIRVLSTPARAVGGWIDLARRRPIRGADVFDLQLVATMLENDVRRIYTFNRADFECFGELEVLTPQDAL